MKRLSLYTALIVVIEVVIFFYSMKIADLDSVKYSLASRYSARLTLLLFEGLLIWMGILGLKKIYRNENRRQIFILLTSLVSINHLIHFIFLVKNHWVNDYELLTMRSAGGALGYVVMIIAPFYLMNRKVLTKALYWQVLVAILFVDMIAFVGYLGRWNKELPMASSKEVYMGIMGCIGVILLINVYRIFAERKIGRISTSE